MDALTRRQFDRAMFAKERTLAIRVGNYTSRDIKEASFEYGYIKGDTYKPGGTCAGSGKITFTSIITTFNKLDILHPEIGLLVGNTYQWVKMGEYFINDIEIDRNRNTTTLELMDGMFKLNREYVTDLHFPAEVREVIQEICLKTGIELANDFFGISAMRYHVEQVPEGKKLSFRDMLSSMTQMIGMSCFFNREGKMEIRDLTESNITINADSYFLHGLTKSEIEYQIAGITCKTDKKSLTVGMKTGRSLELDNVFMTQSALNDLYYKLKNLTYYPYNLNYQGHLLLEVGQWVTIQTNKKETFKVPVLSQSFTFKGGLRGRISADSKAGNDTQYSYEGTITKQIKQQDGIEAKIQAQIEAADAAFDAEFKKRKKEIDDGIELAKAKAEEVKQELSDTINQRFDSFDNGPLKEAKRKAEEALKKAGASSSLAQEAKQIGLDSIARLEAFKSQTTTTQTVLSGDLDALKRTIANDIRPKQAQAEAEIAKQVEALVQTKKELTGVKSAQATYEETTTRRLSELTNLANGKASKSELTQTAEELASKIASVQASGRNLFLNSLFKQDISKTRIWTTSTYEVTIDSESKYLGHNALKIVGQDPMGRDGNNPKITYPALGQFGKVIAGSTTNQDITITFYAKANKNGIMLRSRLGNIWYKTGNVTLSTEIKRYVVHIPKSWTNESKLTTNEWLFTFNQEGTVWIWMPKFEISDVDTSYSEAPEDTDGQISAVESNFKQRADALDAGVRSLTEGLRTKADISSLNVTAENIRQSVKSLETDTQNKLNQKLSLAEFEVRAGSIRQEILNATKDKADKTLVVAEAGKLREEFSKMKVGSRNYAEDYDFSRGLWNYSQGDNSPQDWTISNSEYNVKGTTNTWKQLQIHSKEGSRSSWKSSTALLELELGETYTLSFQGICYSGSPSVWVSLRANRTVPGNPEIINGNFNLTSSWQTYQVTIPSLTKPDNFDFWRIILGYREIGHVAFRKVELTRSSTRIDAGPAPEDGKTDLVVAKAEFEKTAGSLSAKMTAVERYVDQDGQRQEALRRYTREESAKQATSVRELITRDYVGKSAYQEDVRGIERRLEAITNPQNGSIATQIAKYKTAVDGRFADITSMISGKANQTDFQRVRETSQLYERILGNTENGITDKVARMALTNQLFQVEVSKALKGGRNYIRNGQFKNGSKNWLEYQSVDFGLNFNYQHSQNPNNRNRPGLHFYHESQDVANFFGIQQSFAFDGVRGEKVSVSLLVSKDGSDVNSGLRVALHYIKNKDIIGQEWQNIPSPQITSKYKRFTFTFTLSDDVENLNLMLFGEKGKTINLYVTDVQLERGSVATDYKEASEDTDEAIRSVQSQLAGSWAVQNLTSAGALVSGLNLGANGHNRLDGKLTHITGETLIDNAVIKSAMVDKLKTANFETGSVTTTILDAEAVTAEKLKVDFALVRKLTANDAFIEQLTSKRIFSTKVESVVSSSTFLEAYQGRIGGFTLGQFDYGGGRWISGVNQFSVGMGNGAGYGVKTAFWANWGNSWDYAGPKAWYVNTDGKMYCRNEAGFYDQVDFSNSSSANFYGNTTFSRSPVFSNGIELGSKDVFGDGWNPKGGRNAVVWWNQVGSGSVKYWMEQKSDRRLKENITDTAVKALDKINRLNMVAFDFIESKKHEEIGLIAQEVETIVPRVVSRDPENPDGYLHIDYTAFVPYLIKAIQELNQKIEKMEKTIA